MSQKKVPQKGKRNILITSALPYVNNVPHLGNIIGCVLSADVFSRYCQQRGYNALYVCGTDEYGTATEVKARQEGISESELCKKYYNVHKSVYEWFDIEFDYFGRTSTPKQTRIAQKIFMDLYNNKLLTEKIVTQFHCSKCKIFLADRYVNGGCPLCQHDGARGDQCDSCGKLLNATDLINPKCTVCKTKPKIKSSTHLYLNLPVLTDKLESWAKNSIKKGAWSSVAKTITNGWLKEGVKERCITRDLKWGTPVPLHRFKDKVFYVWFDAPIGYISITANYTSSWKKWWIKDKEFDIEYFQFLAKDNVPFHSIIFPSTLLGTNVKWNLVNGLCSTHYLNYEDVKFSKSNNVGVFGNQAQDTGIPSEVWRYYLLINRPELQDTQFYWHDLADKNNNELINNLGNFVNRGLKFCELFFDSKIPKRTQLLDIDHQLIKDVNKSIKKYIDYLEKVKIKDGLKVSLVISRLGNQYIQKMEPWELIKKDKERCGTVINIVVNLVFTVAVFYCPYLPSFSKKVIEQLNLPKDTPLKIIDEFNINAVKVGHKIGKPIPIFKKITPIQVKSFRRKFGGKKPFEVDLRVGLINKIDTVEGNDRTYILKVNVGEKNDRTICANIVKLYPKKDDLLGKKVVVLCNLELRDFKFAKSHGMLLAERKRKKMFLIVPNDELIEGTSFSPKDHKATPKKALTKGDLKAFIKICKVNSENKLNINEYVVCAVKDGKDYVLVSQIGKGAKMC